MLSLPCPAAAKGCEVVFAHQYLGGGIHRGDVECARVPEVMDVRAVPEWARVGAVEGVGVALARGAGDGVEVVCRGLGSDHEDILRQSRVDGRGEPVAPALQRPADALDRRDGGAIVPTPDALPPRLAGECRDLPASVYA